MEKAVSEGVTDYARLCKSVKEESWKRKGRNFVSEGEGNVEREMNGRKGRKE